MVERVLIRKKKNGVIIGCSRDIADRYVACGIVEIIPVSPACNGYYAMDADKNGTGKVLCRAGVAFV